MSSIFSNQVRLEAEYIRRFMDIARDQNKVMAAINARYSQEDDKELNIKSLEDLFVSNPSASEQELIKNRVTHVFGQDAESASASEKVDPRDKQLTGIDRLIMDAIHWKVTDSLKDELNKECEDAEIKPEIEKAWTPLFTKEPFMPSGIDAEGPKMMPKLTQKFLQGLHFDTLQSPLFNWQNNQLILNQDVFKPWLVATRPFDSVKYRVDRLEADLSNDANISRVLNDPEISDEAWFQMIGEAADSLFELFKPIIEEKYNGQMDDFLAAFFEDRNGFVAALNSEARAALQRYEALVYSKVVSCTFTKGDELEPQLGLFLEAKVEDIKSSPTWRTSLITGMLQTVTPKPDSDSSDNNDIDKVQFLNSFVSLKLQAICSGHSSPFLLLQSDHKKEVQPEKIQGQTNKTSILQGVLKGIGAISMLSVIAAVTAATGAIIGAGIATGLVFAGVGAALGILGGPVGIAVGAVAGAAIGAGLGVGMGLAGLGLVAGVKMLVNRRKSSRQDGYEPVPADVAENVADIPKSLDEEPSPPKVSPSLSRLGGTGASSEQSAQPKKVLREKIKPETKPQPKADETDKENMGNLRKNRKSINASP